MFSRRNNLEIVTLIFLIVTMKWKQETMIYSLTM